MTNDDNPFADLEHPRYATLGEAWPHVPAEHRPHVGELLTRFGVEPPPLG